MQRNNVSMLRVKCPYCDYKARNPLSDNSQDLGEHLGLAHRFEFQSETLLANGVDPTTVALAKRVISGEVVPS